MTLASGTRLGPYRILAPIGAGGMGEVYRARDEKLDRDVAIKVLPESVAGDPDTLARFEREAKAYALKGDAENVRTHAEEARKALEEQLRRAPEDAQRQVFLGLALAYLGKKEDAIREGERGVGLLPVAKDAAFGPYVQHQLVRINMLVGEPEKALDHLEPLLKIPYVLSPDWLEIDPNFDPLRENPRFRKLIAGTAA